MKTYSLAELTTHLQRVVAMNFQEPVWVRAEIMQAKQSRGHTYLELVQKNVDDLRSCGIDKINFDLMIGLPLQTLETVKDNVEKAISLSPDRLAIFSYAHVPWMKKHQTLLEQYPLPDTKLRFDMVQCVQETLENAGYKAIGIDHFAREDDSLYQCFSAGKLHRNFQGYTDDPAPNLIGFGLSSISAFDTLYLQNTTDATEYRNAIENDGVRKVIAKSMLDPKSLDSDERVQAHFYWMTGFITYQEAFKEVQMTGADDDFWNVLEHAIKHQIK